LRKSKVHELVVALDFPIIYTTNYDSNIEVAFNVFGRAYVKVANVRDIAKTREGLPQIVKFHGDFDDDDSLVITETDYFNRLSFDTPLDIKFRSDALGKTVLFIGYSMSDLNIRLLLHSLWRTWRLSGFQKDRPRSFIFMGEKDRMQQALLEQWGIEALTSDTEDREQALISFLEGLRAAVGERPESQPERKRKHKLATRARG
jgi:SIR2-like domain